MLEQGVEEKKLSVMTGLEHWTHVPVAHIMTIPPVTGNSKETARELAKKMANNKVGSIIIVEQRPIGIVTDGDLIQKVLAKDLNPKTVMAEEIMSKPLRNIRENENVIEAARIMRLHRVKRLGVTNRWKLIGVVSISDIAAIAPDLFELISEGARRSRSHSRVPLINSSGYCDACGHWSEELTEIEDQLLCVECISENGENKLPE